MVHVDHGGLLGLQHILVCKARVYISGFRLAKAVAVSRFSVVPPLAQLTNVCCAKLLHQTHLQQRCVRMKMP